MNYQCTRFEEIMKYCKSCGVKHNFINYNELFRVLHGDVMIFLENVYANAGCKSVEKPLPENNPHTHSLHLR